MSIDDDWVNDVRRWHQADPSGPLGSSEAPIGEPSLGDAALGYEAALPALQARNWPEAPDTAPISQPPEDPDA